jgi:3-oxoacyl-[acyl-carrier protein] reductase
MGRAIAVALATEGADVFMVARNEEGLDHTALMALAGNAAGRCSSVAIDLRTKEACRAAVETCEQKLGSVDVLVSVAGGADNRDVLELDRDLVDSAIELKLLSTMWLAQLVAPAMKEKGWGRIITVAGSAGTNPTTDNLATSLANVAAMNLTRALSDELSRHGITVNVLCPGPTDTERWRTNLQRRAARAGRSEADIHSDVNQSTPAGRIGTPEEVAAVACFLASEQASYVHGNAIYLDGGTRRGTP